MRILILLVFLTFFTKMTSQVKDNFDDGDIILNPQWFGNVDHFKIDDAKALRLNATDAGASTLYLPVNYPDSFDLKLDLRLEFSPSTSNFCLIYFLSDNSDFSNANSYYISIGENGSTDALRIFSQINGQSKLLASGAEGAMSVDPSMAKIILSRNKDGKFVLSPDYDGDGIADEEITFVDNAILSPLNGFFGINCTYTATRKDKFVFDNFSIEVKNNDQTAPEIVSVKLLSSTSLEVQFNEAVEKTSAERADNYVIEGIGAAVKATFSTLVPTKVVVEFGTEFFSGTTNKLVINNVADRSNNKIVNGIIEFEFTAKPVKGDIVISELLFDPYTNEEDFIELYNSTDKKLEIEGLIIKNNNNGQSKSITGSFILGGKSYVAIANNTSSLKSVYLPPSGSKFLANELPAFNNDAGFASVQLADGTVLDEFEYLDDFHLLIEDTKNIEGVSLEKIKLESLNSARINWNSSSKDNKYATPGYENSNKQDKKAPAVISLEVLSDKQILLTFNDLLDLASSQDVGNYLITEIPAMPLKANLNLQKPNEVILEFVNSFSTSRSYSLQISEILDKNNNEIIQAAIKFGYGIAPKEGDLIISEILFYPNTGGQDFVEVYNVSEEGIQLQNLRIVNDMSKQEKTIESYYVLAPKAYVAISSNIDFLQNAYHPPDTANFLQNSLPSFNLDEGNVSLITQQGVLLDSFWYYEDDHQALIDISDRKGVSLEKISLQAFINSSNWHSSSKAGNYASPGYRNSNYIENTSANEMFFMDKKTFSPNGDSKDDLLILQYRLEKPGFLSNIAVYTLDGHRVKNLTKNELLGQSGILTWDGVNEDGHLERLGIYIIKGTIFDIDGNTLTLKKDCVLASYID